MTLAGGRFKVYVAFGDDPFAASPTWTDVTGYVLEATTSRGRSSELDQFQAGTGQIQLDNTSRLFDPEYTSGTYYGDIKPGVPVKIEFDDAGLSLEDQPMFYGYATAWQQMSVPGDTFGICNLQVIDGFGFLSRNRVVDPWPELALAVADTVAVFPMAEESGSTMAGVAGPAAADPGETVLGEWRGPVTRDQTIINIGPGHPANLTDRNTFGICNDLGLALNFVDGWSAIVDLSDAELAANEWIPIMWISTAPGGSGTIGTGVFCEVTSAANSLGRFYWCDYSSANGFEGYYHSDTVDLSTPHVVSYGKALSIIPYFSIDGETIEAEPQLTGTFGTFAVMAAGVYFGWCKYPSEGKARVARACFYVYSGGGDANYEAWATAMYEATIAPWDGDYTGDRIDNVLDAISWPAALRDVDTGQTLLGPQPFVNEPPLSVLRRIEASEQGWLFIGKDGSVTFRDRSWTQVGSEGATSQETFSDDGSDVAYLASQFVAQWDWTQIRNQITTTAPVAGDFTYIDSASVDAYGAASESVDTVLKSTNELENLAQYRAYTYGEPSIRFEPFSVKPEADPSTLYAALIPLELADRVTVERTPTNTGSPIQLECLMQSISWTITPGDVTVTFQTSPSGINDFATWGSGEWTNDVWGY